MNQEQQQKVFKCIADTLEIPLENVSPELSVGSIPQWDSLGHLGIVSALEEAFSTSFDVDELFEVENVGDFINLLDKADT